VLDTKLHLMSFAAHFLVHGAVYPLSVVKSRLQWIPIEEDSKRFISNEAGAMASTLLAQSISIPGDLLRKTMMVHGYEWRVAYKGGVDIASKIIKKDGFKVYIKAMGFP
ncbi:solute carrier family 25 member 44-like, partial [Trifolium medium]|nr:solute carrier family 25 member 44-like [Trifolium medium]